MSNLALRNVPPSLADRLERAHKRAQSAVERAKEQTAMAVRTAECGATGAAIGYLEGAHDRKEVLGAPVAAVVALGSHLLAIGMGGSEAEHLHAVGDGAGAVYGYNFGLEVGRERKKKDAKAPVISPGYT